MKINTEKKSTITITDSNNISFMKWEKKLDPPVSLHYNTYSLENSNVKIIMITVYWIKSSVRSTNFTRPVIIILFPRPVHTMWTDVRIFYVFIFGEIKRRDEVCLRLYSRVNSRSRARARPYTTYILIVIYSFNVHVLKSRDRKAFRTMTAAV